jgi:hypothetical protein
MRSPIQSLLTVLALIPVGLPTSSARAQGTPHAFADESVAWNCSVEHVEGPLGFGMGGGLAWFDPDADGDEDLLVTRSNGDHVFLRRGGATFVDESKLSGLDGGPAASTMGVIAGDYDQDGWCDVYLTNNAPNDLFRSRGDGTFEQRADEAGVRGGNLWSTSASFADFDRDGDLDLYVGNYVAIMNFPYHTGAPNQLFVNDGQPSPRFFDQAAFAGVDGSSVFGPSVPGFDYQAPTGQPTAGCTLSTCTLDYDEDGDPDLMVGNDFGMWVQRNKMYRNDTTAGGLLQFTDVSAATGFDAHPQYNMGIHASDYDGDGDWDFYLSDLGDNLLLRNDGGVYTDQTASAGPVEGKNDLQTLLLTSWGTVFGDFDNDTWDDLVVVNGYVPAADFIANEKRAEDHLWRNRGDGTFERIDPSLSGMNDPAVGRGVGQVDVDRDGWLDYYVVNNRSPGVGQPEDLSRLYRNQRTLGAATNHWAELRLYGWKSNREGLGAQLDIEIGPRTLKRQVLGDPVYVSSGSRIQHVGLGGANVIDRIRVRWPSGLYHEWNRVRADQLLEIVEPLATLQAIHAPAWDGATLSFPLDLRNHTASAQPYWLLTQFYTPGGTQVGVLVASGIAAPDGLAAVAPSVDLDAAAHFALQGQSFEQRSYLYVSDGIDSRVTSIVVP